jgi:putative peptidoglycan lipid II flippase
MNLLSSTYIFSFYTLISRVLGYIRDILIAVFLGASVFADVFFVAFRIPNTFRRLFAEGTFNAAFIPSYTSEKTNKDSDEKKFADDVLSLLILILLAIIFVVEIFTPYLVYLIAPGFYENSEKFELAVELTRITFPFLLFVSLSSFFSGILHSNNRFAAAAAAPIILNIVLILTLLISFLFKLDFAVNLSYGVTLSGIIQLVFLIISSRKYYKPSIAFKAKINSKVRFFLKKLLPSIFSSGITQINILVGTIIASFETGAVSYLYYADRIYQINLAIAGIAVSIVSLPALSKSLKVGKIDEANSIQNKSIELCFLFSIPASLGLIIASREIVDALFGYGSFSKENVITTANALKYFGYGVPAFALIKILSNFFFARDNTKTPFYLSLFSVLLNIGISITYFREVGFIIIPIATSVSTWITVILYLILLTKSKFITLHNLPLFNFLKIILSTTIMSFAFYYGIDFFEDKLIYDNNYKSIYLLIMIGLATAIYLISCYLFGLLKIKNYKIN